MHIRRIEIKNIRSIKHLIWELPEDQDGAGWHVILGDNGSGKTSFVRSVALSIIGPVDAHALRLNWPEWVRISPGNMSGIANAFIKVNAIRHDRYDSKIIYKGKDTQEIEMPFAWVAVPIDTDFGTSKTEPITIAHEKNLKETIGHIWNSKNRFFSASFGPSRRFSGGRDDYASLFESYPSIARHITSFTEESDLSIVYRWLQKIKFESLEGNVKSRLIIDSVFAFINESQFKDHKATLNDINSKGITFNDFQGHVLPVTEMSDGYRSILSLTLELIRQLVDCFGVDKVFDPDDATKVIAPGVVQIDEVDAHLHPTWQHRIGEWFTTHFPNIQFIVTTHSPIICQAADTVFKLPTPGTDEVGQFITGNQLLRLKYGSVSEAYGTGAFGFGVERSEEAKKLLDELAGLNVKELEEDLTEEEIERQEFLRGLFPSSASIGIPRRGRK